MANQLSIPPEFDDAPYAERIALIEALWDRIAECPDDVPVTDRHKQTLDQRLDAHAKRPRAGKPWSEVRDELLARLRRF